MIDKINQIKKDFSHDISLFKSNNDLQSIKIKYLGKKGLINDLFQLLKNLDPEQKKASGKLINDANEFIENEIKKQEALLNKEHTIEKLKNEWLDVTLPDYFLPGRKQVDGHMSPLYSVEYEILDTFKSLGFTVVDGPQVESDYYNFTALNIPESHPARDMQDTFWMTNGYLLRTQTSTLQIRAMKTLSPPFRVIAPGRVFRNEATDASHENTFYQIEGLMIDKNISVAHLIYFMKVLLSEIFHKEITIRLRPGYFPFVEPGFELDIQCLICNGKGCSVCKQVGWVELCPCGLVHPEVLKEGGINPENWSGFAFGLGLSRLVMMRYGIDDIRWFESGDLRFIHQF